MPFRGKPSQGCSECRLRRKKCDLRPGGCGRCANARRVCPGYPSNELRICDQSAEVVVRARRGNQHRASSSESSSTQSIVSSPSTTSFHSSDSEFSVISDVSSPADSEDHCLAFFFHNYVINNTKYHSSLSLPGNEHLFASITAFGTAGLSKYYSDKRLRYSARHQYVQALSLTNNALRDPERAVQDETLLAILILTNYETLTGGVNRSLEAWEQHINGASTLLRLRGVDGIKGKEGRVLTMHVITFINVICLLKNLATPAYVYELQTKIFEYLYEPESPAMRYQHINLQCADFRHAVSHHLYRTPGGIVAQALELDAKLLAAFMDLPAHWKAEIVSPASAHKNETSDTGLPDFEIRYGDQGTSYIWTSVRSSRILLQETVLQTLQHVRSRGGDVSRYAEVENHARDIVRECQMQILASMPQFLRPLANSTTSPPAKLLEDAAQAEHKTQSSTWAQFSAPRHYHASEALSSELPVMRTLGGYGILWPLFVAGTCSTTTPQIRQYVKDIYQILGDRMKIEQALILKGML